MVTFNTTYTEDQVLARIRDAIARSTRGQRAFAEYCGLSEQYVCDVLNGRRHPGPKLLHAVGLKKVVRYAPVERGASA